jgi:hypothetical protein
MNILKILLQVGLSESKELNHPKGHSEMQFD